jgi:hypothetical protein
MLLLPLTNPYAPLIVAVKVTDWPYTDGFRLDATLTLLSAKLTISPPLNVPVLPRKFEPPEYTAVTECVPTASVEMLPEVAEPDASVTGEPKALPSTLNCTVPVGVPDPDVTFAVKLTNWP